VLQRNDEKENEQLRIRPPEMSNGDSGHRKYRGMKNSLKRPSKSKLKLRWTPPMENLGKTILSEGREKD